jgi:nucleoside-diphosphate-sugar epimerase
MKYHFLTGATGLLGAYLLRDNLRAGRRLAVLCRASRHESARQRVESAMARWERETGEILPRPVVFEGNLHRPNLGLSPGNLRWIARHCDSMVHNAASLTFEGSDPQGEPWLTNLRGTQHVLDVCRLTGIRKLHHVSTAYVCGLREGKVLERELDVGQPLGNDYEKSKVQAEELVRAADFLDQRTVYRPSIIVGDSQTGYTATFHGFYATLKLAHTLVSKVCLGATGGPPLMGALGLGGKECKNFVPVDWVSAVMTHILGQPQHHGKTYHLTTSRPMPIGQMTAVVQAAVETFSTLADESDQWRCDGSWFAETFRQQMDIYHAYWRDDPEFDATNTRAAAPELPCPDLDEDMLMNMAKYAISCNFGKPRPRSLKPDFDVQHHLQPLLHAHEAGGVQGEVPSLGLQVNGPGGGQWKLLLADRRLAAAEHGINGQCTAVFHLSSKVFHRLATHQLTVAQAVRAGRVRIEGNGMASHELESILQAAVSNESARGVCGPAQLA